MTEWSAVTTDATRLLRRNGFSGGALALLLLAIAPPTAGAHGFAAPLAWWLLLAFCLLPLALSVHLLFDAALFRLAGSHEDEAVGLAAIDDVLARMGLRARDGASAPLAMRLAGCRRLLWLQRISLAIAVALYIILLIDAMDGACLC
ncbi:MAG TPA: hypothetical protein VGN93_08960 [Shinella sp.]|jgi:hypothetical protein|uniref:hypothetical protein n=1 Tax=Shinella sp. TaxID=1870904 RepID=UPI002E160F89|nr:hypothetical protein [Shinella sp.]